MPTLRDHTSIDARLYFRSRSRGAPARVCADFRGGP
jgi:hypothetical protein